MKRVILCASLALTAGCSKNGAWLDAKDLGCGRNPFEWFGGLSRHLDFGDVGEGEVAFNYDPPEVRMSSITGLYNTSTGDFSYTISYQDHYLTQDSVSGYGTVFQNGAIDVLYTVTRTDILGAVEVFNMREERYACEGYIERWDLEEDAEDSLTWRSDYVIAEADRVDYETEYVGIDGFRSGDWASNLSDTYYEELYLADEDYYAEGVEYGNGSVEENLARYFSDIELYGFRAITTVGDETSDYTGYESDETDVYVNVHEEFTYDGAGIASYDYVDGESCEYVYESDGSCSTDCSGGCP